MLKPLLFSPSRARRPSTLAHATGPRTEVCPPALLFASEGDGQTLWQRLMAWLLAPAPQEQRSMAEHLAGVRTDFVDTLDDIRTPAAAAVRTRIEDSRSLRELWHVRAEIYRVVGLAHSQFEAERRLNALNRHFPTRAARPQLAPL